VQNPGKNLVELRPVYCVSPKYKGIFGITNCKREPEWLLILESSFLSKFLQHFVPILPISSDKDKQFNFVFLRNSFNRYRRTFNSEIRPCSGTNHWFQTRHHSVEVGWCAACRVQTTNKSSRCGREAAREFWCQLTWRRFYLFFNSKK